MLKKMFIFISSLLIGILIIGCASTSIAPQKHIAVANPIQKMSISVGHGAFNNGNPVAAYAVNETIQDIMPRIKETLPIVFQKNGIEIINTPEQYEFVLIPTTAKYISYGGHVEVNMKAIIRDKVNNSNVWEANMRFWRPGFSKVDVYVAEKFVQTIIDQLKQDGMIIVKDQK